MKKILIQILLFSFLPVFSVAQVSKCRLIDSDTATPVQNANVFLAGTLIGTTTNKEGYFELNSKGILSIPVVISFVGYKTKQLSYYEIEKDSIIIMEKDVQKINEIDVKSGRSGWPRDKMLRVFKEEFLGTSFFAQSCKIENKKDIYLFYNSTTKSLHAHSLNPLIIENKLLNYKITYVLESFQKSESGIKFKGYNLFEELPFKNEKHKKRIIEQRAESYLGSIMHFMRYLNNIVIRKFQDLFQLYDSLGNYISNSKILADTLGTRRLCYDQEIRILYLGKLRNSYFVPNSDCIEIAENGYYNPDLIGWYGLMSKFRVGDMLPYDYVYNLYEPKKKHYLFE